MKKKILFLNCDSEWFGSEKILYYIIKALSSNFTCYLVLPYEGLLIKKLKNLKINISVLFYPILRKKYLKHGGIFIFIINFFYSIIKLIIYTKKNKIDIIYSNSVTVLQGFFISKLLGKKHIWHIHSIIEKPGIILCFLKYLLKLSYGKNIFVSESLLNKYNLLSNKKNIILHNGIEPLLKEPVLINNSKNDFIIGVIGTFNEQKGQIYLLQAVNHLLKKYNLYNIKIILTGPVYGNDFRWLNKIKDFIKESKLESIVELYEFIEDVNLIYEKLDLFVLTSIIFDPFPTVVLESMSSGIPVLAFNNGGVSEMLENDNLCLIETKNYIELSKRINFLYNNIDLRIEKAKNNLKCFYNKFYFPIFEKKIISILKNL